MFIELKKIHHDRFCFATNFITGIQLYIVYSWASIIALHCGTVFSHHLYKAFLFAREVPDAENNKTMRKNFFLT